MSLLNKDFMTTREAAERLGVALSTVQHWSEKGLLKTWKTGGGHRRIARNSVEALRMQQLQSLEPPEEQRLTVLVVEDQPQALKLYQEQFSAREFPIDLVTAGNGFEGLVKIGRYKPDVIITDLHMPGMDGFQMIRSLKRLPEFFDRMIIVVSALSEAEINEMGGFEKDLRYFSKPIPFQKIGEIFQERLQHKKDKGGLENNKSMTA